MANRSTFNQSAYLPTNIDLQSNATCFIFWGLFAAVMVLSFGLTAVTPDAYFALFDPAFITQGRNSQTTVIYPNGTEVRSNFSLQPDEHSLDKGVYLGGLGKKNLAALLRANFVPLSTLQPSSFQGTISITGNLSLWGVRGGQTAL